MIIICNKWRSLLPLKNLGRTSLRHASIPSVIILRIFLWTHIDIHVDCVKVFLDTECVQGRYKLNIYFLIDILYLGRSRDI